MVWPVGVRGDRGCCDCGCKLRKSGDLSYLLAPGVHDPGVSAVEQQDGDGSLDHVSGYHDQVNAACGQLGYPRAQRVLSCGLALRDRLVSFHDREAAVEMRLVTGDEHDPGAWRHEARGVVNKVQLRVTIQPE